MKTLVEFLTDGGEKVYFEVETHQPTGPQRAGKSTLVTQKAHASLEQALAHVKPAADLLLDRLTGLSQRPNEIEVQFGITVSGEVGAFIASGSVEANYTVTLKWYAKEADNVTGS